MSSDKRVAFAVASAVVLMLVGTQRAQGDDRVVTCVDERSISQGAAIAFSRDGASLCITQVLRKSRLAELFSSSHCEVGLYEYGETPPRKVESFGAGQRAWAFPPACYRPLFLGDEDESKILLPRWQEARPAEVQIVNLRSGETLHTLRDALSFPVKALAFSPDGSAVAIAEQEDFVEGRLTVWNLADGSRRFAIDLQRGGYGALAFSPDGKLLAAGGNRNGRARLSVFEVATGEALWHGDAYGPKALYEGNVIALSFSPDGQTLVSGGLSAGLQWWDASNGTLRKTMLLESHPYLYVFRYNAGSIYAIDYSPDGKLLAIGLGNYTANRGRGWGALRLLDASSGNLMAEPLKDYRRPVSDVEFSPDGSTLAARSADHVVRLWRVETSIVPPPDGRR